MHSNKIIATSIMADDTSLDNPQNRNQTSQNMMTSTHTSIEQPLPENDSHNQPKTKYYGDLIVPTPFKDALFWPETPSTSTKSKLKLPSVITSDRWQIFAQNKQEAKTKNEENKVKGKENKS
ncbi:hypothetical protein B5X24_HaOG207323 [Helicoverpa armigera]|uniref:Uncharacterized protein n=1 Tax=Helicoverpa armigera TaxID=29058 RepID=A0A2W1BIL3_HELAM|nr:hypothetical protein B5X24_HaOG207323 [Helicoverpa armigera]